MAGSLTRAPKREMNRMLLTSVYVDSEPTPRSHAMPDDETKDG